MNGNNQSGHAFKFMRSMKTTSAKEAEDNCYRPLTTGYKLPKELPMLNAVLDDMDRGNIETVLVLATDGVEVWRHNQKAKN